MRNLIAWVIRLIARLSGLDVIIGSVHAECVYGENRWQQPARLYSTGSDDPLALDKFEQIEGELPSFINYTDFDRLLQTETHIAEAWRKDQKYIPCIAIGVKHGNACGGAVGGDPHDAIRKMVSGNPRALHGGVVLVNFEVGADEANLLLHHGMPEGKNRLLDGILAPSITTGASEVLKRKKAKCRLFVNLALANRNALPLDAAPRLRFVRGGYLMQPNYTFVLSMTDPNLQKSLSLLLDDERDLLLAWAIGSTSNSNTITIVKDGMLIGNGVGQMDRVGAAELAIKRARDAGHDTNHAVAYSDSFFPFPDGPETLAAAGIKAIFTSSGGVNKAEIEASCRKNRVALYTMPDELCRGFYAH